MKPYFFFLSVGGLIFGVGMGAKFAEYLGSYAIPIIVGGLIIHGIGHVMQIRDGSKRK